MSLKAYNGMMTKRVISEWNNKRIVKFKEASKKIKLLKYADLFIKYLE